MSKPVIGVLALQGDFKEHCVAVTKAGAMAKEVRTIADAEQTQGMILPGGESTTIGKLLESTKLNGWIKRKAKQGYPVYGTCAGCILISKTVDSEYSLQLIDISVQRNAYGRQLDSFETELQSIVFPKLLGVFIRAPRILNVGRGVTILAHHINEPVLVQQDNILAGTFHPELSHSLAVHTYFVTLVQSTTRSS